MMIGDNFKIPKLIKISKIQQIIQNMILMYKIKL